MAGVTAWLSRRPECLSSPAHRPHQTVVSCLVSKFSSWDKFIPNLRVPRVGAVITCASLEDKTWQLCFSVRMRMILRSRLL